MSKSSNLKTLVPPEHHTNDCRWTTWSMLRQLSIFMLADVFLFSTLDCCVPWATWNIPYLANLFVGLKESDVYFRQPPPRHFIRVDSDASIFSVCLVRSSLTYSPTMIAINSLIPILDCSIIFVVIVHDSPSFSVPYSPNYSKSRLAFSPLSPPPLSSLAAGFLLELVTPRLELQSSASSPSYHYCSLSQQS